jgi:hypothetical protein
MLSARTLNHGILIRGSTVDGKFKVLVTELFLLGCYNK